MRNEARGDVWKVWLYAVAALVLGAWMTPLLYNAGKALAEVSSVKTTNGFIEWLAGVCRNADFRGFVVAAMWIAAMALFFPWMEWIHARRGDAVKGGGPWLLRLPVGARMSPRGQPLRKDIQGLWHACAGFMVVAGLLLSMGVALVPAGFFTLRSPAEGMAALALKTLAFAVLPAFLMEVFFRGVAMGIFLRAMRPAAALGMSAAFFALVVSMIPNRGATVADPDASRTGFEMLGYLAAGFSDWRFLLGEFTPLLALGGVLAYARWRTRSLWLPVGLHTGWLFSKGMLASLSAAAGAPLTSGSVLQQGLVPLAAILVAGFLAHYLTAHEGDETIVHS